MDAQQINELLQQQYADRAALQNLAHRIRPVGVSDSRLAGIAVAAQGWAEAMRIDPHTRAIWLAEPGQTLTGVLVGLAMRLAMRTRDVTDSGVQIVSPAEVLARVNQAILTLESNTLVAFAYALYEPATGSVRVARGGTPPPIKLGAGTVDVWHGPAPFLGAFDVSFEEVSGTLAPGERLILTSAGDPALLVEVAQNLAERPSGALAEALRTALTDSDLSPAVVVLDRV